MKKLVSPMAGRILKINVRVGQTIEKDEEILIMKTMKAKSTEFERFASNEHSKFDEEEFPQYQTLYEYCTCNESLALLAELAENCK